MARDVEVVVHFGGPVVETEPRRRGPGHPPGLDHGWPSAVLDALGAIAPDGLERVGGRVGPQEDGYLSESWSADGLGVTVSVRASGVPLVLVAVDGESDIAVGMRAGAFHENVRPRRGVERPDELAPYILEDALVALALTRYRRRSSCSPTR